MRREVLALAQELPALRCQRREAGKIAGRIGVVVVAIILMTLFVFWGSEKLGAIFGKRELAKWPRQRVYAAALFAGALIVPLIGQPSTADKLARISAEKQAALDERAVQIHPGELLATIADDRLRAVMLDVRPEADYNLFHIEGAQNNSLTELAPLSKQLIAHYSPNTVYGLMSNDESAATEAWRILPRRAYPTSTFWKGDQQLAEDLRRRRAGTPTPEPPGPDRLAYTFPAALGARYSAAAPNPHEWGLEYTPKIRLELKRDKSGGGWG